MQNNVSVNEYTNKCLEELKSIFINNNINGFTKVNMFKEIYRCLENDYSIDLYSRKSKNNQALYTLLINKKEVDIFIEVSKRIIKAKGYSIEYKKDNIIELIKKSIKKIDKREQEYFYRKMYSELNLKGINLYSRRSSEQKPLIDFIDKNELDILKLIFSKLAYEYKLEL